MAVRAQRLKLLARETPDVPAATEFSRDEIDAVIVPRKPKGVALGATPTLGQLVRWIADPGGDTGKSSGGPPGIRVIAGALPEVNAAAAAPRRFSPTWSPPRRHRRNRPRRPAPTSGTIPTPFTSEPSP